MASKITITFNQEASAGDVVSFRMDSYSGGVPNGLYRDYIETFITSPRGTNGVIQAPTTVGSPAGSLSASSFRAAWNIDFNSLGTFIITVEYNVVTIEAINDQVAFSNFSGTANITAVIDNIEFTDFTIVRDKILPSTGSPGITLENRFIRSESVGAYINENYNKDVIIQEDAIQYNSTSYYSNKIIANSTFTSHYTQQTVIIEQDNQTKTFSAYCKEAGLSKIILGVKAIDGSQAYCAFDLLTGGVTGNGDAVNIFLDSFSISNETNGWYRCSLTFTSSEVFDSLEISLNLLSNPGNGSWAGNEIDGVYFRGAQLNDGGLIDYVETADEPVLPTPSTAVDFCNKFTYEVETSEVADTILINGLLITDSNTDNPYSIELLRDIQYSIVLKNTSGEYEAIIERPTGAYPYLVPKIKNEDFYVQIVQSIAGASLQVFYNYLPETNPLLTFEYSLDGFNWQSSPRFTGQIEGDYTIYVRDKADELLGCRVLLQATVNVYGSRNKVIKISEANSIGFIKQEDVDDCSIYRNDENSFDYQSLAEFKYCQNIPFNTCDKSTIQIKSSYNDISVRLREDGTNVTETQLVLAQKSNNMGLFKSMDCFIQKHSDTEAKIFFTSGNYYDESGLDTGEDYILNGNLPDFAIVGQILELNINGINLGSYEIKDVIYDRETNKKVIIIDYIFYNTTGPYQAIASSLYNVLDFNVFEFTIDWSLFGIGLYDLIINFEDSVFPPVYYISENIEVKVKWENTVAIRYYNDNNRDIFYKTGIQNFIRVPLLHVKPYIVDEIENNITDLSANVISSTLNDGNTYIFDFIPRNFALRLAIALSCENLFINGLGYVKASSLTIDNEDNTNLEGIKADLIKNGVNYNNTNNNNTGFDITYGGLDIPSFIIDSGSFLKS